MRWILLPVCSAVGMWLTVGSARRQLAAWKLNPPQGAGEKWANVPFTVLWYFFLSAFCIGLTVNNLFLR
jgi:hypothetical protein